MTRDAMSVPRPNESCPISGRWTDLLSLVLHTEGMEAVVIRRWWVGPVIAVFGAAGLAVGWLIEGNGNNAAVLAVLSAFAVAVGSLLAANAAGEIAVRVTGGLLFIAG